ADATAAASTPAAAAAAKTPDSASTPASDRTVTVTKAAQTADTPTEAAIAGTGEGAEANAESTPAAKKKSQPRQKKTGFSWWPKLAWAGAGFAVLAVAAWFAWQKTREPDVNQLLAQAYTEQRTIELRIPGAKYAKTRITRGRERSSLNRPTSLL